MKSEEVTDPSEIEELEFINRSHVNGFLFTNENRAAIVYLLSMQDKKRCRPRELHFIWAFRTGTALYHLEILSECRLRRVRVTEDTVSHRPVQCGTKCREQ